MRGRFIIVGKRFLTDTNPGLYLRLACVFISRNGCTTYDADSAAVLRTKEDAKKEVDYWRQNQPRYKWRIEQLPEGPKVTADLVEQLEREAQS